MNLENPRKGQLQQGTVFSCCAADDAVVTPGWGVVITARCDLAASKTPLLNYLPIVSIDDWMEGDGLLILSNRCKAEAQGEVRKLLSELGAPDSVLLATPADVAITTLVGALPDKKRKAIAIRAERVIARWSAACKSAPSAVALKENFGSTYSSLIKELMTHRLAGYYYLPRVEIDQDMGCYVVLLRQIRSIPGNLAKLLPGGLRRADVLSKFPDQAGHFRWPDSASAAIPEGVIPSPHIEHLLQSFSLLFGRIGLPDTDSKHIEKYLV